MNVDDAAIEFDDGLGSNDRTLLAEDVTIANNLIRSSGGELFQGRQGSGWTIEGNIAFGDSLGVLRGNSGVTEVDPQLVLGPDGLFRPGAGSPAIDGASGNYSGFISDDVDGQPRVGLFDVGADEFSTATIVRRPLVVGDVGPDFTGGGGDGGGGDPDPPGGCSNSLAIQSEDFSALLDPDGNGDVWTPQALSLIHI